MTQFIVDLSLQSGTPRMSPSSDSSSSQSNRMCFQHNQVENVANFDSDANQYHCNTSCSPVSASSCSPGQQSIPQNTSSSCPLKSGQPQLNVDEDTPNRFACLLEDRNKVDTPQFCNNGKKCKKKMTHCKYIHSCAYLPNCIKGDQCKYDHDPTVISFESKKTENLPKRPDSSNKHVPKKDVDAVAGVCTDEYECRQADCRLQHPQFRDKSFCTEVIADILNAKLPNNPQNLRLALLITDTLVHYNLLEKKQ